MRNVALFAFCTVWACSSPTSEPTVYDLPDRKLFLDANVSGFLEARCGSLDCHGNVARPLRIYSQDGLRRDVGPNGQRDRGPTTDAERLDNYRAVIGLEPEEISKAVATKGDYTSFMLLEKPIDIQGGGVRHKGGPVLAASESDPGWACLTGWIAGAASIAGRCRDAANIR